jgi:hypothetical protein
MSQPAHQPIWLTPGCVILSIYTLKLTGHLEALCNAIPVFVIVFILAYVSANMMLPSTAQEDIPPTDSFAEELQEKLARVERVEEWRESAMQWGSSELERSTDAAKPTKKHHKKEGKLLRKVLKHRF